MAMGRGSAIVVTVLMMWLVLLHCEMANAAIFTVGDAAGWTFNVVSWPIGKHFKAGDILVFKYNPLYHNVVAVDIAAYKACTIPKGAKVLTTGNDQFKLVKGQNFFICAVAGHCQSGMKIAITVL